MSVSACINQLEALELIHFAFAIQAEHACVWECCDPGCCTHEVVF